MDILDTIKSTETEQERFDLLYDFTRQHIDAKLFTIMTVDMQAGLARRAYTNMPKAYPTSGTKPITRDAWFEIVHDRQETFVANTLADIAKVFPDYDVIGGLGCGSVINLPIVQNSTLAATINILNEEHYFTPERVEAAERMIIAAGAVAFTPLA